VGFFRDVGHYPPPEGGGARELCRASCDRISKVQRYLAECFGLIVCKNCKILGFSVLL